MKSISKILGIFGKSNVCLNVLSLKHYGLNTKNTISFDFDQTIYDQRPDHKSYIYYMYESANKEAYQYLLRVRPKTIPDLVACLNHINKTWPDISISQKDIEFAIYKVKQSITPGFSELIRQLKNEGYPLWVIGGGHFGGNVLYECVKDFGINKQNVCTGAYCDLSQDSINQILRRPFGYTNNTTMPTLDKKSEVIRYLRGIGLINGTVIHIGDGMNDLEVKNVDGVKFIYFHGNIFNRRIYEDKKTDATSGTVQELREKIKAFDKRVKKL